MGLTCSNVHVYSGVLAEIVAAEIDQLISHACQRLGYEAVTVMAGGSCVAGSRAYRPAEAPFPLGLRPHFSWGFRFEA